MQPLEEPRSPLLYASLRKLLERSLGELKTAQGDPVFLHQLNPFDFEPAGETAVGPGIKLMWLPGLNIKAHMNESEFVTIKDECLDDVELRIRLSFVALSGVGGGGRSFELFYEKSVLEEYVMKSHSYTFDDELFDSMYAEIELDLFSDVRRFKSLLPIAGLAADDSLQHNFGPNVTFRRLTARELATCIKALAVPFQILSADTFYAGSESPWALVAEVDAPVTYVDPAVPFEDLPTSSFQLEDLRSLARPIVEAARLVGGGSVVATRQVTTIPFTKFDFSGSSVDESWVKYSMPDPENPATITASQSEEFWETFELLAAEPDVATRRLVLATLRTDVEDSLIDLVIALEAMFASDSNAELTERISLRAALVAGKLGMNAYNTRRFVRQAYDARSRVVHGKRPKDNLRDLNDEACDLSGLVGCLDRLLRKMKLEALRDPALLDHEENVKTVLDAFR